MVFTSAEVFLSANFLPEILAGFFPVVMRESSSYTMS